MSAINNQQINNMPEQDNVAAKKTFKRSLKKNVSPAEFNGPSRPPTGFMLFSAANRDKVTEELRAALKPDEKFKISSVATKIGALWKEASEEQKAELNKQAQVLKAKYDEELEKWQSTNDYKAFVKATALHSKKRADKKATDTAKESGMPQRPMAGYMIFANTVRDDIRKELEAKGEKYSVANGATMTKEKWTALGAEGQEKYQAEYRAAKAKYDEDLKAWQETDAGKQYAKAKATNAKRKAQNSKVGRSAKRAKKDAEAENGPSEAEDDVEESVEEEVQEEAEE